VGFREVTLDNGGERLKAVRRVLWIVLFLNLAVAFAKIVAGYLGGSISMVADGFHSTFDGSSNVIGLVGLWVAGRPADADHPYGHGKYETIASLVIGGMLLFAAFEIASSAWAKLTGGGRIPDITWLQFAVMIGTLVINLAVTTYERRQGLKLNSEILIADASHTSSDVMVSLGVLVGLIFVKFFNMPLADPIIALFVAGAIVWTAWGVFKQANSTLSDSARMEPSEVTLIACGVPGVIGVHDVRTRGSMAEVYIDLHVQVDPEMPLREAHAIAEAVERALVASDKRIVDVIVHIEPNDPYQEAKTVEQGGAKSVPIDSRPADL
jgi:cation diffusion facilitator family transporter